MAAREGCSEHANTTAQGLGFGCDERLSDNRTRTDVTR
jgi:hypothetical protein